VIEGFTQMIYPLNGDKEPMLNSVIIVLASILLIGLLYYENKENRKGLLPTKTLLSFMFILAILVQPHQIRSYYYFLLVGMVLCFGGDIFLALPQKRMFLYGLISFLLGLLFYIVGFFSVARVGQWTWVGLLTVVVISTWIYVWLRPYLGPMNGPVLLYIIIITVMVCGAWSVLGDYRYALSGRIMAFLGAFSFYFSDVFVARDRFLKKVFLNRLIGLPLYYSGQFLLAFSVGLLR